MRSRLLSLRSAPNEMHSPFSASFHLGEPMKSMARRSPLSSSGANARRLCQPRSSRSFHASPGRIQRLRGFLSGQSVVRTSRGLNSQLVKGASRHRAAPGSQFSGAAEYGSSVLSLRSCTEVEVAEFTFVSCSGIVPCSRATPNPSIKRTNNGGPCLLASATAVPPLFAAYLKRWASR